MKPEKIAPNLYVGNDETYEYLKDKTEWAFLRCCKYGPGGHQDTLGYRSLGAPKGPDYLAVTRSNRMALNFIDVEDPNLIPREMVAKGLDFVAKQLAEGRKVLIACNAGHSRGPTTAMLYLRSIGELPGNFIASEHKFKVLYPLYDPGQGARQFARSAWSSFAERSL